MVAVGGAVVSPDTDEFLREGSLLGAKVSLALSMPAAMAASSLSISRATASYGGGGVPATILKSLIIHKNIFVTAFFDTRYVTT